jgi:two-component system, NtrC family, sensor kinase
VTGRAILTRSVIHLPDLVSDAEHTRSELLEAGFRAILAVPMLRDGAPIGAITVTRRQPEPFSEGEISLLQTFADQAVIAIENVRLFKELVAMGLPRHADVRRPAHGRASAVSVNANRVAAIDA